MMKKETRENIYLHPRWFVEVDLNYLKINKDKIINFKRYNYLDRDEAVLNIHPNLLHFLENHSTFDWSEYCDVHEDFEGRWMSLADDVSLASDEFLLLNYKKKDLWINLNNEAGKILELIDNHLDDYNEHLTHPIDYIRRDDLNFLAMFLLRLATRLKNLE